MTPKEKAKELCDSMYHCPDVQETEAKRCALIAVNELIEEHTWTSTSSWEDARKKYWQEVKTEIEKL